MRATAFLVFLLFVPCLVRRSSAADVPPPFEGGVEVWVPHNGQNRAWLAGPRVGLHFTRHLWLQATHLSGAFRQDADVEHRHDTEAIVGVSLRYLFLGAGFRYHDIETRLQPGWRWAWVWEELERNADIFGPVLLAGTGGTLGGSAFSWHLRGVWLLSDYGPLTQVGYNPAYGETETGFSWSSAPVSVYAGYRLRIHHLIPPRNLKDEWFDRSTFHGAVARVTMAF